MKIEDLKVGDWFTDIFNYCVWEKGNCGVKLRATTNLSITSIIGRFYLFEDFSKCDVLEPIATKHDSVSTTTTTLQEMNGWASDTIPLQKMDDDCDIQPITTKHDSVSSTIELKPEPYLQYDDILGWVIR